jgi:hypothetical protein
MVVIPFTRKKNIKRLQEHWFVFSKRIQLSSEVQYLGIILSWIESLTRPTRPSGHVEAHLGKLGD